MVATITPKAVVAKKTTTATMPVHPTQNPARPSQSGGGPDMDERLQERLVPPGLRPLARERG